MSSAKSAFGTLLKIGNGGSPESFTAAAEIREITPPQPKRDKKEVTHMASPGGWKEYLATLKDGGEVKLKCNWLVQDPTQSYSSGLLGDFNNATLRNFQVVFTDPATTVWSFAAYVIEFAPMTPIDDAATVQITLAINGGLTLA